jgi:hypothetical protein
MATSEPAQPGDFADHQRTYRAFVRGVAVFAAHVAVILLILAYAFSSRMG